MWQWIERLAVDEGGQDVVEYALVTAAVGLAGAAAWPVIIDAIETAYGTMDTNQQNLWEPDDPTP